MTMSNLYSKLSLMKRNQEQMPFSQQTPYNEETLNNGLPLSPPHNNYNGGNPVAIQQLRGEGENIQVTQPVSVPSSPLASPGNLNSNFNMPGIKNRSCHSSGSNQSHHHGHHNSGTNGNTSAHFLSASLPSSPVPIDTGDPNWQASKSTVRERNAAMFNNDLMADIKFVVGSAEDQIQTIPAHKYVLATGSSVFYAMFYGGLAENKSEIIVPDVEPSAFLILLRYLYCDEIFLEADTVLATLYVAKKYIVPHLARACVNFLETSLTAKNACLLLSQSRLFEEPELMQRCWEVIDAQVCLVNRVVGNLSDGISIINLENGNEESVVVNTEIIPLN